MNVEIIVPEGVYEEIVDRPLKSKRFALESLRIKRLFSDGVISEVDADPEKTKEILKTSNHLFYMKKRPIQILHRGEAEALSLLVEHDCEALLVDERTTRLLVERPEKLLEVLSRQNHKHVEMDKGKLNKLKKIIPKTNIIRSTEIAAIAYEKGILARYYRFDQPQLLDAALAALKYSGCAISWQEIEEYKKAIS
ncbi:hypothetical protein ACFLRC_03965 [Candidatus Altiarchaeota archaeon]